MKSWVAAWLEFFFRSTLELFLDVGDEDGGQLAWQGMELMGEMASGSVAKASRRKNKSGVMSS
jgi:hypothetical protein